MKKILLIIFIGVNALFAQTHNVMGDTSIASINGVDTANIASINGISWLGYSAGGGGGETGEIFADDFEDGNATDDWSVYLHQGSNTITAQTDTANAGYAAQFFYAGTDAFNYISIPVANKESIYFRGYFRISNGALGVAGNNWQPVVTFTDATTVVAQGLIYADPAGTTFDEWIILDPFGNASGTNEFGRGTWKRYELGYERGTGANGFVELRIDGVTAYSRTALDFTSYLIDSIKIGNSNESGNVVDGYLFWDDIVIDSTDWVGAKP